jgi:hypothetical protein
MKKILLILLVASSFLLYSTPSFALLSLSVGVPIGQAITGKNAGQTYGNAPDKTSGYFLGASFASIGLGIDSYTTKFKTDGTDGSWDAGYDAGLKTNMTNLFYQLPVPVVNLIIGLGVGTTEYDCTICETYTEKGSATQWYTSIGIPLIPLFDIHLSYRSITSKNIIKNKMEGTKDDNSGSVTGLGISFNF